MEEKRIPCAPVIAVEGAHPHGFRTARLAAAYPDIAEIGRRHRDRRVGRVMGIAGGPEVTAAAPRPAVPELILGRRIAVGVRIGNSSGNLRPFVSGKTVVRDRSRRRPISGSLVDVRDANGEISRYDVRRIVRVCRRQGQA
jgi:hypothetical protein